VLRQLISSGAFLGALLLAPAAAAAADALVLAAPAEAVEETAVRRPRQG
jgi:hypothetical protein